MRLNLLFFLSTILSTAIVSQTFDKTYDESFFNEIEIQSDGYLLHQVPDPIMHPNFSTKQLKTDLLGELRSIEHDSFPLKNNFCTPVAYFLLIPKLNFELVLDA